MCHLTRHRSYDLQATRCHQFNGIWTWESLIDRCWTLSDIKLANRLNRESRTRSEGWTMSLLALRHYIAMALPGINQMWTHFGVAVKSYSTQWLTMLDSAYQNGTIATTSEMYIIIWWKQWYVFCLVKKRIYTLLFDMHIIYPCHYFNNGMPQKIMCVTFVSIALWFISDNDGGQFVAAQIPWNWAQIQAVRILGINISYSVLKKLPAGIYGNYSTNEGTTAEHRVQ